MSSKIRPSVRVLRWLLLLPAGLPAASVEFPCVRPPPCRAADPVSEARPAPRIRLELCLTEDGKATPTWTEGIAVSLGRAAAESVAAQRIPLSLGAARWTEVLREALPRIQQRAAELALLFDVPTVDALIAVGNRASSDGFGWGTHHIGINVAAFEHTYGMPDEGALDRMTRIVAHEYLHLLTYAFYPNHSELRTTPLDRALWTMFFEGIGDYVSVSRRWFPDAEGAYSPVAQETLNRLEPIFVERLEALASATPEMEEKLRTGISMGRFDEKWGSLPVALWLHSETAAGGEPQVLREMMRQERSGVLPLALRHAAPRWKDRLQKLQEVFESE